jgi:hypothetical protein
MYGAGWQEFLISGVCVLLGPVATIVLLVLVLRRLSSIDATLNRIEQNTRGRGGPPSPFP